MHLRVRNLCAVTACIYVFCSAVFLLYLMYSTTVNLPALPDNPSIYWWRDASIGRYIARHTCTDSDVHVVCDTCCYCYTPALHILADFGELGPAKLAERQCEKRLPQAIIIGAMKSGTYALRTYLSYHPDIAMAYDEGWFWNRDEEYKLGLDRYRDMMHYSTPGQVTMEKTPDYYHAEGIPKLISQHLPNVKLIIIMKDPVKRAISHYNFDRLRTQEYDFPATFEQAVMKDDRHIDQHSPYIALSTYAKYVREWLRYFPPDQLLALDGDPFLRDPLPQLQRIERFLEVRSFFNKGMFVKDKSSGLWCLSKPISTCVPQSQPHPPHPQVSDAVLVNLYRYFRPYNKQLLKLLDEPFFEWYSY